MAMRASDNQLTKALVQRYDKEMGGKIKTKCANMSGLFCDLTVGSEIGWGQSLQNSFSGPDDLIFDKKMFNFMKYRSKSCELSYFIVPMGQQAMSYSVR